jgi:predicted double-glycine peptidase
MRKLFGYGCCFLAIVAFVLIAFPSQGNQSQATAANSSPSYSSVIHRLVRINQLDPEQYNSAQDYNLWAYSACSTAAMTEVFNFYGRHYRIADILKIEAQIQEITPVLGLVEDAGIQRTAAKFGFRTDWGYSLDYDQVVATANRGEPVIVGWPPAKYQGGHLVVVTGGDSQTIFIADSSIHNRHSLSRAAFMKWWGGLSAIITTA